MTVDGAGSSWTNSGDLWGRRFRYRQADDPERRQGEQRQHRLSSGSFAGRTGTVTVDGAGSSWTNSGSLFVGYSGTGTLTIANGGAVSAASGMQIAP